ncbi:MAG TPA: hypothetical protein VHS53_16495, partial [Mucilaginibacter sp.]|nr:hypothetical protein [Mucilaginibacter sp.]
DEQRLKIDQRTGRSIVLSVRQHKLPGWYLIKFLHREMEEKHRENCHVSCVDPAGDIRSIIAPRAVALSALPIGRSIKLNNCLKYLIKTLV